MNTETTNHTSSDPRRTALGSPCSPAWDDAHVAVVDAAEASLGRRICGARTISGNPCTLDPNHANGRCRFHGGFDLTGAQPGNRNAVVHGLYSRAIQTCGDHCPLWNSCPCAGPDVAKLAPCERPRCPYEVAAFNAAVTDARAGLAARALRQYNAPRSMSAEVLPLDQHVACDVATLRVVMMRAAAALAAKPLVDVTVVTGEKYHMSTAKPGAYLQAYLRVARDYRQCVRLYGLAEPAPVPDAVVREQDRCAASDTSLLPEDLAQCEPHDPPIARQAKSLLNDAEHAATTHDPERARRAFRRVEFLSPDLTRGARDPRSESYLSMFDRMFPAKKSGNGARIDDS